MKMWAPLSCSAALRSGTSGEVATTASPCSRASRMASRSVPSKRRAPRSDGWMNQRREEKSASGEAL